MVHFKDILLQYVTKLARLERCESHASVFFLVWALGFLGLLRLPGELFFLIQS